MDMPPSTHFAPLGAVEALQAQHSPNRVGELDSHALPPPGLIMVQTGTTMHLPSERDSSSSLTRSTKPPYSLPQLINRQTHIFYSLNVFNVSLTLIIRANTYIVFTLSQALSQVL